MPASFGTIALQEGEVSDTTNDAPSKLACTTILH
jgi:hypothetical protein